PVAVGALALEFLDGGSAFADALVQLVEFRGAPRDLPADGWWAAFDAGVLDDHAVLAGEGLDGAAVAAALGLGEEVGLGDVCDALPAHARAPSLARAKMRSRSSWLMTSPAGWSAPGMAAAALRMQPR